jgi:hypothetical protein
MIHSINKISAGLKVRLKQLIRQYRDDEALKILEGEASKASAFQRPAAR